MDFLDMEAQRLRIQADRIQQLKELLSDPAISAIARQYLGVEAPDLMTLEGASLIRMFENQPERKRGELTEKVQAHVESRMDEYSALMVIERMSEEGFKFIGQRPQVVVTDILRKMRDEGKVEMVHEGIGPKPAFYRTIQKGAQKVP